MGGSCLALFIQRVYCWNTHTHERRHLWHRQGLSSHRRRHPNTIPRADEVHTFRWRDEISSSNSSRGGSWNRQLQLLRQALINLTDKWFNLQISTVRIFNLYFEFLRGLSNIFYSPMPTHVPYWHPGLPSSLWPKCNRLLRLDAQGAQLRCDDEVDCENMKYLDGP
jgi:hypothetical protein